MPVLQTHWLAAVVLLLVTIPSARAEGVKMERVAAFGWDNNIRVTNGDAELIITLDVGPRVISYRALSPTGPGPNVFKVYPDQAGKTGEPDWQIRGGHRLWAGPEDLTRTYALDNGPVEFVETRPGIAVFRPAPEDEYGLQKELEVHLDPSGTGVTVTHRIRNIGKESTRLAVWCLSVMAPGGTEIMPMPAGRPHPGPPSNADSPADYAPDRLLVLWPFFDFKDPRWCFGSRFITLRQDATRGPTKIGLAQSLGWSAYELEGTLFVKHFPFDKSATYPDGGCNFETFTNQDMLEIESLGPLLTLAPGEEATHAERWQLFPQVGALPTEGAIERELLPRLRAAKSGGH